MGRVQVTDELVVRERRMLLVKDSLGIFLRVGRARKTNMSIERTVADTTALKAAELLKRGAETVKRVAEDAVEGLKETGEQAVETLKRSRGGKGVKKGIPAVAPDLATLDGAARYKLAADPKTPEATLRKLAEDKNEEVLAALAGNPNTPPEILERITRGSSSENIFYGIAKNPSAPPELLRELTDFAARHDLAMISQVIVDNPSNPLAAALKQAEKQGMLSLVEDGFIKAVSGLTNLEEVMRVTQE